VAIVDAWDPRAGFDRFPRVGVVRAIRRHRRNPPPTIIVVTGCVVNEMLRARMAEAGADFLYSHEDVSDLDRLSAIVLDSASGRRGTMARTDAAPPHADAALDWIRAHAMEPAFSGESQKALPFSRRTLGHVRREVWTRAGLGVGSTLPRWRKVADFVNRARGPTSRCRRVLATTLVGTEQVRTTGPCQVGPFCDRATGRRIPGVERMVLRRTDGGGGKALRSGLRLPPERGPRRLVYLLLPCEVTTVESTETSMAEHAERHHARSPIPCPVRKPMPTQAGP
jgi:hypothetical protein